MGFFCSICGPVSKQLYGKKWSYFVFMEGSSWWIMRKNSLELHGASHLLATFNFFFHPATDMFKCLLGRKLLNCPYPSFPTMQHQSIMCDVYRFWLGHKNLLSHQMVDQRLPWIEWMVKMLLCGVRHATTLVLDWRPLILLFCW